MDVFVVLSHSRLFHEEVVIQAHLFFSWLKASSCMQKAQYIKLHFMAVKITICSQFAFRFVNVEGIFLLLVFLYSLTGQECFDSPMEEEQIKVRL